MSNSSSSALCVQMILMELGGHGCGHGGGRGGEDVLDNGQGVERESYSLPITLHISDLFC